MGDNQVNDAIYFCLFEEGRCSSHRIMTKESKSKSDIHSKKDDIRNVTVCVSQNNFPTEEVLLHSR